MRFLLHLAANSAALDQVNNGSIDFVGGAAGQCLANIHALTLEASRQLGNPQSKDLWILWLHFEAFEGSTSTKSMTYRLEIVT